MAEIIIINKRTIRKKLKRAAIAGAVLGCLYGIYLPLNFGVKFVNSWLAYNAVENAIEEKSYTNAINRLEIERIKLDKEEISELEGMINEIHPDRLLETLSRENMDSQMETSLLGITLKEYDKLGQNVDINLRDRYLSSSLSGLARDIKNRKDVIPKLQDFLKDKALFDVKEAEVGDLVEVSLLAPTRNEVVKRGSWGYVKEIKDDKAVVEFWYLARRDPDDAVLTAELSKEDLTVRGKVKDASSPRPDIPYSSPEWEAFVSQIRSDFQSVDFRGRSVDKAAVDELIHTVTDYIRVDDNPDERALTIYEPIIFSALEIASRLAPEKKQEYVAKLLETYAKRAAPIIYDHDVDTDLKLKIIATVKSFEQAHNYKVTETDLDDIITNQVFDESTR